MTIFKNKFDVSLSSIIKFVILNSVVASTEPHSHQADIVSLTSNLFSFLVFE